MPTSGLWRRAGCGAGAVRRSHCCHAQGGIQWLLARQAPERRAWAPGARALAAIVVVVIALLPAGLASAAPSPRDGGEIFGRATRSTAPTAPAAAAAVPARFTDNLVFGRLTFPTAIAFAPGGKVFVGEKSGIVKVFDSTSDPTATQVVDLRPAVHDFWDRGLLGLAVDPRLRHRRPQLRLRAVHPRPQPGGQPGQLGRRLPHPTGTHH
jgi:hypothetical protein